MSTIKRKRILHARSLALGALLSSGLSIGQNVVVNGDFGAGNSGFTSDAAYFPPNQPFPPSAFGTYTVAADPTPSNGAWCGTDHTSGSGNLLICDGLSGSETAAWKQTVALTPGVTYRFDAWVVNIVCTQSLPDPSMALRVGGQTIAGPVGLPEGPGPWVLLSGTFVAASTSADLAVVSTSTVGNGNDFGIDDVSVVPIAAGPGCTVLNGDFEFGDTGFGSDAVYFPPNQPFPPSAFGTYTVAADPAPSNGVWCGGDHTSGTGLFLICDGIAGAPTVAWRRTSPVTPGASYEFEAWVMNLVCTQSLADPVMELRVDSQTIAGPIVLGESPGTWVRLAGSFTAAGPSAELEVVSISTAGNGNDFGIDDVSLSALGAEPDCNGNGTPDICDIAQGVALDLNGNAVPDSCEAVGVISCTPAVLNSTGRSARITALGSSTALDNDLALWADQLPPHQTGYFLANSIPGSIAMPGGSQGVFCLGSGPNLGRYQAQAQSSGPAGVVGIALDLNAIPVASGSPHALVAGETWYFQCWFRDNNPGSTSNFTDAVSVIFN